MGGQFNKFSQTIALKQTTPHTQAGDVTAEAFIQMSYVCHGMTKMLQEKKKKRVEREAAPHKRQRIPGTLFELPVAY